MGFKIQTIVVAICFVVCAVQFAQAGQGCPFDNASCQEYCSQQGCNYGYCGHFAWIQCICRKCGDEWGYYDKVHYNPDKQVNQTELDSLKLNRSDPLILTNNNQQQAHSGTIGARQQPINNQRLQADQQQQQKQATLTTLLIPDLSDETKLDLNDIPEENSEKFLDFLAKNHEKLVRATSEQQQQQNGGQTMSQFVTLELGDDQQAQESVGGTTTTTVTPHDEEEMVEIQISSSNNNTEVQGDNKESNREAQQQQQKRGDDNADADEQQHQHKGTEPMRQLLMLAVAQRNPFEIERKR